MARLRYPVIVTCKSPGMGYEASIPDLHARTEGTNMKEAYQNVQQFIINIIRDTPASEIPKPRKNLEPLKKDQVKFFVDVNL